ncbi:hypothetical protein WKH27_02460 [Pantoea agglomerans]|uniref:hypothetical protein n=1 Tax=Enterobacter agglomerans TaxID=549 RepID=UPI0028978868|nr:hypothetical protein [Pantoea agglomerans]WNK55053.1 hypothetical protein RM154_08475 [Pantoea agglomerans]
MTYAMDLTYKFMISFSSVFILITLPILISFLIIHQWMKSITKNDPHISALHGTTKFTRYIFTFHTNKGLGSQGLFWFSIILPFFYFLVFGFVAWRDSTLKLDAEGFKTFISISTLPLGMLSLAVPLSVSVARFHGSKQTAKQIEIVSVKNNIDLFNSHRKELFSYFSQVGETKYSSLLKGRNHIHPRLHKNFFVGKPEDGTPQPNQVAFASVERDINSLFYFLDGIIKNINKEITYDLYVANYCPQLYRVSLILGIVEVFEAYKDRSIESLPQKDGVTYRTVGFSTEDSVAALRYVYDFFKNLCDFAGYNNDGRPLDKDYYYLISGEKYKEIRPQVIERITHEMDMDRVAGLDSNNKIIIS